MTKELDNGDAKSTGVEEVRIPSSSDKHKAVSAFDETDPKIVRPEDPDEGIETLDTVEVTPEQVAHAEGLARNARGYIDPLESTREFPVLEAEEFWFIHNDPPPGLEPGTLLDFDGSSVTVLSCIGIQTYERRYRVSVEGHAKPMLMRQGVTSAPFVRYAQEMELLEALHAEGDHPAVPRCYGYMADDNCQFIVTPPPVGQPYIQLLDNRAIGLRDHVQILRNLVALLRDVHRAGFILTSLRPTSFHVGAAPDFPVQLSSFLNIIRAVEPPPYGLASPFTAPEVAEKLPGDEGVDFFSLGALLYRAVTGEELSGDQLGRPFHPTDPRAQSPMVFQVLIRTLSPPTERFLDILDIEKALEQLYRELEPKLHIEVATQSSTGINPLRIVNQDSSGYLELKRLHRSQQQHLGFYCVADGMGGHEAGDRASELAVEGAIRKFTELSLSVDFKEWKDRGHILCKEIASAGSANLVEGAEREGLGKKMGTTFTSVLLVNNTLSIAHLGDSRAVLVRDGKSITLTEDHSLVAMMVKAGQLTPEQAERAEEKNILIRSLGADQILRPPLFDGLEVMRNQATLELEPGDCVVLVSDGVWGMLPKGEILNTVESHTSTDNLCHQLCQKAIRQGGLDNVIVLALEVRRVNLPRF